MISKYRLLYVGAFVFSGSASAAQISVLDNTIQVLSSNSEMPISTQMNLADASQTINWNAATDVTTLMGSFSMAGVWNYDWKVMADPDPFIDAVFSVTNMSATTQTFTVNFGLGVSPSFTNGAMLGDLTADFEDTSGDGGVTFSVDSWWGQVNGVNAMALSTASFTPVICSGSNCTGSFSTSDGPLSYTGVVNDIGLSMSFTLSAGDTASFDTRFEIQPVPVPAALWLFGSGLLGLIGMARRSRVS